ncbi:MAG: FkbM family methyltransferase [Thiocapsa sp.]|uniref:FkbM family methyltransferase n=1 Tax=Thiocapsa sp. TaxID=2024551 RepID=UPI001BCD45B6|nr:FkbM family methyltransferase [Thiocapsa sp.]QVL50089.1 MAG: FkbM family methyltransferase [Thiocapsa sp.]
MAKLLHRYRQGLFLWKQLRPFSAFRLSLAEMIRRLIDKDAVVSYSQAGEDRLIEQILFQFAEYDRERIYVDVGANEPIRKSNTFRLYVRGWHGLAIDGNDEIVRRYQRNRPRDLAICAIVSKECRDATFQIMADPALSRISGPDAVTENTNIIESRALRTTTLAALFEQHGIPHYFGLLNIDVEGSDFDVLSSFDISIYRPALIVIEMHDFAVDTAGNNRIFAYLVSANYQMVAYAGRNGFFLDRSVYPASQH